MGGISDEQIQDLMDRAIAALAARAQLVVLVPEPLRADALTAESSGWCEIGRIAVPSGRMWWVVRYHPESGDGRMVRYFRRSKRGPLGEIAEESP